MDKKDITRIEIPQKGPYRISGSFSIIGIDGKDLTPTDGKAALCACGKSGDKPFCDCSHARQ